MKEIITGNIEAEEYNNLKRIPGYSRYYATPTGRVYYNLDGDNYRECSYYKTKNKSGKTYLDISMKSDVSESKMTRCRVSRVIAYTFLSDIMPIRYKNGQKVYVQHTDNDSMNNAADNLYITTSKSNSRHAYYDLDKDFGHSIRSIVLTDSITGEVCKEYESIAACMKDYNIDNHGVLDHYIKENLTFKNIYKISYKGEK